MVIEVPFALFALLMPFIAHGPRIEVLGLSVSEPGLLAGVALLVKGTIGVLASLTLAATTEPQDLLRGLQRLRMPDLIVQIMGFMIRYLDVVTGELVADDGRDALARLRPALAAALADAGPCHGRAVHPLLRARRARAPRDALARLRRHACPRRAGR